MKYIALFLSLEIIAFGVTCALYEAWDWWQTRDVYPPIEGLGFFLLFAASAGNVFLYIYGVAIPVTLAINERKGY